MPKHAIIDISGVLPIEFKDEPLTLEYLQSAVGGRVETVSHGDKGLDLWFNEEGKLEDLECNERATMIAHHARSIFPQDYIAGNCVVTGPVDDDGESTELSTEQIHWLEGLDRTYRTIRGYAEPTEDKEPTA